MRSLTQNLDHTPGIGLFGIFVFLLVSMPRLGMKVGPVPVYAIDFLILLLIFFAGNLRSADLTRQPFQGMVIALLAARIASEFIGYNLGAELIETVYTMGRVTLAFSVFFLTWHFVRTPRDLEVVLKAAVIGGTVTCVLMIMTSLPMTRPTVIDLVFGNRFLEPAADIVERKFGDAGESGVRGRTLVGVSIMSATYINVIWPLAALLALMPFASVPWRRIATIACILAPIGVLMSYSRGPIIGSIMVFLAVLVFSMRGFTLRVVAPLAVLALIVLSVGANSSAFFFERLVNRTQAVLDDPFADERESERILAYVEPFQHVLRNPQYLVVGEGTAILRSDILPEQSGKATHALFGKAYYTSGMVSAVLFILLVLNGLYLSTWHASRRRDPIGRNFSRAMLLALLGMIPWVAFTHGIVSAPRGTMFFFLVLGLTSVLRRFPLHEPFPMEPLSSNANDRHITV